MRNKKQLLQSVEQTLCMPTGTLCSVSRVELTAHREALVEGCLRILEYEEHRIRLQTVDGIVTFEGEALCVNCLADKHALVSGNILTLSFAERCE